MHGDAKEKVRETELGTGDQRGGFYNFRERDLAVSKTRWKAQIS